MNAGKDVSVGVIGYGYWGPNLVRNLWKTEGATVSAVVDGMPKKREQVNRLYPSVRTYESADELMEATDVDGVVIATPISTHFNLAKKALEAGKHVLVEKPLAETSDDANELISLAERAGKILMVDHTFIYSGPVRTVRKLIEDGEIGDIYYYDSVRVNLGLFQSDVNVVWDLAPHDFSIMLYLLKDKTPVRVSAIGSAPVQWQGWRLPSIAYVTIHFDDETLAHLHLNWLSPVKIRRTLIGGSRKMAIYDHLDLDNPVKIFDKGVEPERGERTHEVRVRHRAGDMHAPQVDQTEALEYVCQDFVQSIQTGRQPLSDGQVGLDVVRLLEAAQQSMDKSGATVDLT